MVNYNENARALALAILETQSVLFETPSLRRPCGSTGPGTLPVSVRLVRVRGASQQVSARVARAHTPLS